MQKWYAPSLLWFAVCAGSLAGCTQTAQFVGRWTGKDSADSQTAQVDGKAAKDAKAKPGDSARIAATPSTRSNKAKSTDDEKSKRSDDESIASAKSAVEKPPIEESKRPGAKSRQESTVAANQSSSSRPTPKSAIADEFAGAAARKRTSDPFDMSDLTLPEAVAQADSNSEQRKIQQARSTLATSRSASPPIQSVSHANPQNDLPEWARDPAAPTAPASRKGATEKSAAPKADPFATAGAAPALDATANDAAPTTLAALCPDARGEIRELLVQLESSDLETMKRSIYRLGRMQSAGASAAPALRKLLSQDDGTVRVHAALALIRMQQTSPEVTQTLIFSLRSSDPAVRSFAAAVISEMGPKCTEALPALTSALHDRDGYVRLHVAEVLIRHEEWSHEALQTLVQCLHDQDENVRWLATYSLAELAPQSPAAVAGLASALRDPSQKVQVGAAYALGELGPIAQPVRDALAEAARSRDPELRAAAESALQHIR